METLLNPAIRMQAHCQAIGERVPYFEADSSLGRISLDDDQGQWIVLFSYPADCRAVCSTEVVAFGELRHQFNAIGCQVPGLSTDIVHTHIPQLESLENWLGDWITYPIKSDYDESIAQKYLGTLLNRLKRRFIKLYILVNQLPISPMTT